MAKANLQTLVAMCVMSCFALPAFGQIQSIQDSAKWIPESANYVAIVRAERIFNSPLAEKEGWKKNRRRAFKAGMATFPSTTESVLIASQVDFQFMDSLWIVSVFKEAKNVIDIVDVSKRVGGNLEKISGLDALVLPNDAYLFQVDDKSLVSVGPANRQMTQRLIRAKSNGITNVSPYLTKAINFADKNADMIIAMDVAGVLSVEDIADRLRSSGTMKEEQIASMAEKLHKVEGVTLGVTVRDKIRGVVKIDFSDDPLLSSDVAKSIFISALERNGVLIDDMLDWNASANGNQILIQGDFSLTGLQELASLTKQPLLDSFVSSGGSIENEVSMATRSKQYFSDVETIIERLTSKRSKSLKAYARWFHKYGSEIGQLPTRGVDEELLDYGSDTAVRMREIANSLDSSNLDRNKSMSKYRDSGYVYQGRYNSWNWGGGAYRNSYYNDQSQNRRIASNQANIEGGNKAKEMFREIQTETDDIRRKMSQKYDMDF